LGTSSAADASTQIPKGSGATNIFLGELEQVTSTLLKSSGAANQDWGEVVGAGMGVDLPKPPEVLGAGVDLPVEVFGFGVPMSTDGAACGSAD